MRRVHISNAVKVYSLRVSPWRLRAVNTLAACACCGEIVERALLIDVGGDRVCCRVDCVCPTSAAQRTPYELKRAAL
jgi:hypothetical protein